jgi:hypothetical protein
MAGGTAFFRTDLFQSSEQNTNGSLDPRSRQGSYDLISARIGWSNERYRVIFWGENLGDTVVLNASAPQTLFGGIDGGLQQFLNDPTTYGINFEIKF